jgi:hypothetical protein
MTDVLLYFFMNHFNNILCLKLICHMVLYMVWFLRSNLNKCFVLVAVTCPFLTAGQYQPVRLSDCQNVSLSECQTVSLSECRPVSLSDCQPVRLWHYTYVTICWTDIRLPSPAVTVSTVQPSHLGPFAVFWVACLSHQSSGLYCVAGCSSVVYR